MTDLSDIASSSFWRVNPPDADPAETREWLEAFDALVQAEGRERAMFLLRKLLEHARARRVPMPPVLNTPVPQQRRARRAAAVPGQPRARAAPVGDRALERARDGGARQPRPSRARRAHRQLRLRRRPVRGRLQPLLPRRAGRRPGVLPAALGARGLRQGLPRGQAVGRQPDALPARDGRQGPVVVPPSVSDALVLAVPHRLDGPGADQRDLPGALHALPRRPRPAATAARARCGPSSATARWTSPSRSPGCRSPRARGWTT